MGLDTKEYQLLPPTSSPQLPRPNKKKKPFYNPKIKYLRCLYIMNREYFLGILIKCVLTKKERKMESNKKKTRKVIKKL